MVWSLAVRGSETRVRARESSLASLAAVMRAEAAILCLECGETSIAVRTRLFWLSPGVNESGPGKAARLTNFKDPPLRARENWAATRSATGHYTASPQLRHKTVCAFFSTLACSFRLFHRPQGASLSRHICARSVYFVVAA